eukprot:COSAG01_NODE_24608_length_773_cov_0.906528_1_plen_77_part_00
MHQVSEEQLQLLSGSQNMDNTCTSLLLPALRADLTDAADDWIALVLCITAEEEYMGTTLGMALMHLSSPSEASMDD